MKKNSLPAEKNDFINEALKKGRIEKKLKKEISKIYSDMYKMLEDISDFAERLAIVTDTIENIFRKISGKEQLSYEEYAFKRNKRRFYKLKKYKKIKVRKKWKKIMQR